MEEHFALKNIITLIYIETHCDINQSRVEMFWNKIFLTILCYKENWY